MPSVPTGALRINSVGDPGDRRRQSRGVGDHLLDQLKKLTLCKAVGLSHAGWLLYDPVAPARAVTGHPVSIPVKPPVGFEPTTSRFLSVCSAS